jgi:hypothetical protein
MNDERRSILTEVAEGRISPEAGAARLEELDRPVSGAGETTAGVAPEAAAPAATKVRIHIEMGSCLVVGDPSVREAVAEGKHSVRRTGDTLEIEGQPDDRIGWFFDKRWRDREWRNYLQRLTVRVNPDVELWLGTQAGSARIRNVRGPIHVDAQAGSVTIDDFTAPLELSVQAGSVRARGTLDRGESRVHCEAGSVRMSLTRDSSVQVKGQATMGKVTIDGGQKTSGMGLLDSGEEAVIGAGAGSLLIDTSMGSVRVAVE